MRPTAQQRGYNDRWRKARATYLSKNPFCRMCQARGMMIKADVVDHITPHKNDSSLFWNKENWQPLCAPCHNSTKQKFEVRGYDHEVGLDGFPVDPLHPSNQIKKQ